MKIEMLKKLMKNVNENYGFPIPVKSILERKIFNCHR